MENSRKKETNLNYENGMKKDSTNTHYYDYRRNNEISEADFKNLASKKSFLRKLQYFKYDFNIWHISNKKNSIDPEYWTDTVRLDHIEFLDNGKEDDLNSAMAIFTNSNGTLRLKIPYSELYNLYGILEREEDINRFFSLNNLNASMESIEFVNGKIAVSVLKNDGLALAPIPSGKVRWKYREKRKLKRR